jgi:leucyl aminopeptidase (aminopeptidase T)
MMMMPTSHKKGSEPPDYVAELMRKQDIVILATKSSMTHTKARINASRTGRTRIISMPGISELMFSAGGMTADYNALQKELSGLTSLFRRKRDVKVTSPGGTDITFSIGAKWRTDDNGICNRPGQVMNLPSGRVFVFPKEETMNGTIVIDGSWEGKLIVEPIIMEIENGVVTNISESEFTEKINLTFDEVSKSLNKNKAAIVKTVAEFGFGMNARAKVIGNLLEDQVVRGAAHFILGDNSAYGGKNNIGLQMRGVILKPTIELKDIDLVKDGKIVARRN